MSTARTPDDGAADFRGDLQADIMAILWRLGEGRVGDVRGALPPERNSAYTTVQTVMNRLADRGLLDRERAGSAFVYRPRYEEADYLSRSIGERLSEASSGARTAALINLVGNLDSEELSEITRYANRIRRARDKD